MHYMYCMSSLDSGTHHDSDYISNPRSDTESRFRSCSYLD